jgi:hypothetical protein
MRGLFSITNTGEVSVDRPFIVECGCASASAVINNMLKNTKLPASTFPRVKLSGNRLAKKYLQDNGFYKKYPILRSSTYALLVDPSSKTVINFYMKDKVKLAEEVKNVLQGN